VSTEARDESLTPEQSALFTGAADAALRVRRNILLLAAHASGHMKHPHGDSCEECGEHWPCVPVMRAAGPSLNAVAALPSQAADVIAERDTLADQVENLRSVVRADVVYERDLRIRAEAAEAKIAAVAALREKVVHGLPPAAHPVVRVKDLDAALRSGRRPI